MPGSMSAHSGSASSAGQIESPKVRLHKAISRSRSFHQAFLDAKAGATQTSEGQNRSLESIFSELYKKALQRVYATRPPPAEDDSKASGASPPASSPKGRFRGTASRLKLFLSTQSEAQKERGGSGDAGRGGCGSAAEEGVNGATGGGGCSSGSSINDAAKSEDSANMATKEQDSKEDLAGRATAEGSHKSGTDGGAALLGQLKGVFESGGELDDSQQSEEQGPSDGGTDPQADLKRALKEQMEAGKGEMDKALDESIGKLTKASKPDSAGAGAGDRGAGSCSGGKGSSFFASVKAAAQGKLQLAEGLQNDEDEEDDEEEEEEDEEEEKHGKQPQATGPHARNKVVKPPKPPRIEIKSDARQSVFGKDQWLPCGLSPRQVELRTQARELVLEHVLPNAATWDSDQVLPRRFLMAAGLSGFCGMIAPLLAGGRGWSYADAVSVMEVLGAADLNTAALLAHQNRITWIVANYAGPLHKLPITAALSSGMLVGTCAASEPQAQKDAKLTASFGVKYKDMSGDYWIVNGYKDFTPLCGQADLYLVAARTDPTPSGLALFMLPKVYPGMAWVGPAYNSVGVRSLPYRNMALTCCILKEEMRMAAGKAVECINDSADRFRLLLAAAAVGAAAVALSLAHDWLADPAHRHFSHDLIGYQALEHRLVGLTARVDSARLLVQNAAAAFDSMATTAPAHAALAKRFAVTTAFEVLEGVRTMFGAASVHVSYPLERVRRNLIVYQLLGGDMEDCVGLAWSGIVSKRKVKGKKGSQHGKTSGGAASKTLKKRGLVSGDDGAEEEGGQGEDIGDDENDGDEV